MTRTSREIKLILVRLGLVKNNQDVHVERTYAGRNQRAAGWVSWVAIRDDCGMTVCGSIFTCGEIIKADRNPNKRVSVYYSRHDKPELLIDNETSSTYTPPRVAEKEE